jgi:hypothetical protein
MDNSRIQGAKLMVSIHAVTFSSTPCTSLQGARMDDISSCRMWPFFCHSFHGPSPSYLGIPGAARGDFLSPQIPSEYAHIVAKRFE